MMISGHKKRKNIGAQIKRILIYSALLFILAVSEGSFFSSLDILPATPDLILGAVTAVALTDTRETAVITAVVGGVMADALLGVGIYLSPLFYLAAVLIISPFSKKMLRSYLSWLTLFPIALLMRALYTVARTYLFGGGYEFTDVLLHLVLPETVCTALLSLALYPLVTLLSRIVRSRRDMS